MKNWKIAALFTCSCLISLPALAVEQSKNAPIDRVAEPQSELKKEDMPTSFDKKTFIERSLNPSEPSENTAGRNIDLSAAFDLLDKNHDGKVDSKELQAYSDSDTSDDSDDPDDNMMYVTEQPLAKNATASSSSGAVKVDQQTTKIIGIPPVNAGQMLK